jgi:hypothetical protein
VLDGVLGEYGPSVRWAAAEAKSLLGQGATRWSHVQGVVAAAMRLMMVLPESERPVLLASAYLHDIGWAPAITDTSFHPIDGARWLRRSGHERLAGLVAHHSAAKFEAELRGLTKEMAEFDEERSATADTLTYCDLVTGPSGEEIGVEERWVEIQQRYGAHHVAVVALHDAKPTLHAIVKRTEARLSKETPARRQRLP